MSDPAFRIKAQKAGPKGNRYPDNVGDAATGGQHYMLIKSYKMDDPRMTTTTSHFSSKNVTYKEGHADQTQGMVPRTADWTCALYIPPGSLRQTFAGKYTSLEYGASMIRGAQATADLASG
ncbi:uncharacterized protein METZ01_LOCUS517426, partial [marine metagenome]